MSDNILVISFFLVILVLAFLINPSRDSFAAKKGFYHGMDGRIKTSDL